MKGAIGLLVLVGLMMAAMGGLSAARARPEPPRLACVESADGSFCLCKAEADVCAGEHAVKACAPRRAGGACCVSPVGFCYCSEDARCTDAADRPVDRCGP